MKIILLKDVKKVGKKGEVVDVADGYGRNYLIANKLGVLATNKSVEILGEQKEEAAISLEKQKEEANKLKETLSKIVLEFDVNSGSEGKVFGSVSSKQIVETLEKEQKIKLDKRKFVDSNPLTTLGYHDVKVELFKGIIGTVRVHLKSKE